MNAISLFSIIFVFIDIFDFKNSEWRLIRTRILSYDMSSVDLTANISQWKTCYKLIALKYKIENIV